MMELTQKQREFAEANYGVLEDFLKMRGLPQDEFYDVVVFRFLRAVQQYDECEELRQQGFQSLAGNQMQSALSQYFSHQARQRRQYRMRRVRESGPTSLLAGHFRFFSVCRPCLAPARLRPSHEKVLKNFSARSAKQFPASRTSSGQGRARREYWCIAKGMTPHGQSSAAGNRRVFEFPHPILDYPLAENPNMTFGDTIADTSVDVCMEVCEKLSRMPQSYRTTAAQGSRKMSAVREIFWEEEEQQSGRLIFCAKRKKSEQAVLGPTRCYESSGIIYENDEQIQNYEEEKQCLMTRNKTDFLRKITIWILGAI